MAKAKKKAGHKGAAGGKKQAKGMVRTGKKAGKAKKKSAKKASSSSAMASIARLETFAPAPKKPLRLPVTPSTTKPIRPESVRPRSWIERTVPSR